MTKHAHLDDLFADAGTGSPRSSFDPAGRLNSRLSKAERAAAGEPVIAHLVLPAGDADLAADVSGLSVADLLAVLASHEVRRHGFSTVELHDALLDGLSLPLTGLIGPSHFDPDRDAPGDPQSARHQLVFPPANDPVGGSMSSAATRFGPSPDNQPVLIRVTLPAALAETLEMGVPVPAGTYHGRPLPQVMAVLLATYLVAHDLLGPRDAAALASVPPADVDALVTARYLHPTQRHDLPPLSIEGALP